jgi:hypothetical protein
VGPAATNRRHERFGRGKVLGGDGQWARPSIGKGGIFQVSECSGVEVGEILDSAS